jgi:acetyltransferase-like isoleucine patch superfamily enzyme
MKVGRHTYGHQFITVHHWGEPADLTVGSFCSIYKNINVFLGGNHRTKWGSLYPFGVLPPFRGIGQPNGVTKGNVTIGSDVWLGYGVTIMSGVSIGHGSAIAANSHVVNNIPPYSIVGGNPAKVISKRFTDDQIADLLKYPWWELDDEVIKGIIPLLNSFQIDDLICSLKEIYNKK